MRSTTSTTRQIKGINTLLINLVEHKFSSHAPNDAAGHPPFTTPGDFGTPNEAYFAHADTVLAEAEKRGMLVLLEPAYMGYEGGEEGWYRDLVAGGPAKIESYGRFVAERLKNRANIVWVLGGDFNPPELATTDALIAGIRQVDGPAPLHLPRRPQRHRSAGHGRAQALASSRQYLHLHGERPQAGLAGLARVDPAVLLYRRPVREPDDGRPTGAAAGLPGRAVRCCGSGVRGRKPVAVRPGLAGGACTVRVRRPFRSYGTCWRRFHGRTFGPTSKRRLLASGTESGANAAAAAIAEDRSFALVYLPTARTIKVRLSALAGPQVRARWFDPRVGSFASAAANVAAEGEHSFDAPGNGSTDSVLVLESVTR